MDEKEMQQDAKPVNRGGMLKEIDRHIIEELLAEQTGNDSTDKTNKNLMKAVKLLLFRIKLLEPSRTLMNKKLRNRETGGKHDSFKPELEYIG